MIIFLIIFLWLCIWQAGHKKEGLYKDFLSIEKTNAIKGIFIVVVFINHIKEYYIGLGVDLSRWYDNAFFLPAKVLGQLMVVMFLFYSGYGVYESIKKKGDEYVRAIPYKRVFGTLVNFDIAVIIFSLIGLLIGKGLDLRTFGLSLIAWKDMGNSNWYVFCIIACYLFTYISHRIFRGKREGVLSLIAMIVLYVILMSFFKGTWWYNTIFAYGAGAMFSMYKDFLLKKINRSYVRWFLLNGFGFITMLSLYIFFYSRFKTTMEFAGALVFNLMSVFFAFSIVLITMKVSLYNPCLEWLGAHLFPIYIYQRLPMMILSTLYSGIIVIDYPYFFLILCMMMTGLIAYGFRFFNVKIV